MTKLFSQKIFNTYGVVALSFSGWFIIYLLSRFFTKEDLGRYSLGLSIVSPIALFFQFQIRNFFNSKSELQNINVLSKLRLIGSLIFLLIIFFLSLFLKEELFWILIFLGLTKTFEMFSEYVFAQKQKEENIKYIGKSLVARSGCLIISLLVCAKFYPSLNTFLLVITSITLLFAIKDLLNIKIVNKMEKTQIPIKEILPLSLSALLFSFNINIPKYFLEIHLTTIQVGIFTTLFLFYNLPLVLSNSLLQVYLNKFSNSASSALEYKKLLLKNLKIILLLTVIIIALNLILGEFLYLQVYSTKFKQYSHFIYHLNYLIPLGLIATFSNYKLISLDRHKSLFRNQIIVVLSHLLLAHFLINSYQIKGAFIAFGITLVIHIISNSITVFNKFRTLS